MTYPFSLHNVDLMHTFTNWTMYVCMYMYTGTWSDSSNVGLASIFACYFLWKTLYYPLVRYKINSVYIACLYIPLVIACILYLCLITTAHVYTRSLLVEQFSAMYKLYAFFCSVIGSLFLSGCLVNKGLSQLNLNSLTDLTRGLRVQVCAHILHTYVHIYIWRSWCRPSIDQECWGKGLCGPLCVLIQAIDKDDFRRSAHHTLLTLLILMMIALNNQFD